MTMLGLLPSLGRQILSVRVESLDVNVFDRRANVGEAPGNALVVSDDHIGIAGQRDSRHIEVAAAGLLQRR